MSVVNAASYLKDATIGAGNAFRDTVVRVCLSCCTVVALLWVAILMYISFYYAYMPTVHHTQPVFLEFSTDCNSRPQEGLCSFPEANVSLSKGERILMRGQKYQVFLDLDMPHSPVNERLGMFMVSVKFLSNSGKTVATSSRSCMLHFRSGSLKLMYSMLMAVPLVLGFTEEKQSIAVRLFENYVDDSYHPVTTVNIIVMAKHIEVYSALLRIEAQFVGLRFILFNWPMTSALVCISANFIVICIIFFFAYNAFIPEPAEQTVIEIETEEDGQERLPSEVQRDADTSVCRLRRQSQVRVRPPSPPQHGRSRSPAILTRNKVPNLHHSVSTMHLSFPCHYTPPTRRLRSASFPSFRWEPNDTQAASDSSMGEVICSAPCTPSGGCAPVYLGFQVGDTKSYIVPGYFDVKGNRDSKGKSWMDSPQSNSSCAVIKKSDSKDKVLKKAESGHKGDNYDIKGRPCPQLSPYTILEPNTGKRFKSYSEFKAKKANPVEEKENNPITNGISRQGSQKSQNTTKLKKDEQPSVKEEKKKPIFRRSTNKSRTKFGLSLKKMFPKR